MLPSRRNYSFYLLLLIVAAFLLMIGVSEARDLRPADHGLVFQSSPEAVESPGMASFFDGASSFPPPRYRFPLPEAKNMSDLAWRQGSESGAGYRRGGEGRDHVKDVLLVASLVCGITGVVMLLAAATLFIVQRRRKQAATDDK